MNETPFSNIEFILKLQLYETQFFHSDDSKPVSSKTVSKCKSLETIA